MNLERCLRNALAALIMPMILVACSDSNVESVDQQTPGGRAGYTQLVAFGDSLSDVGTYNPTTGDANPANDTPIGLMFTTKPGGTWPTYVAANLGLPLAPNRQVNFGVVGQSGRVIELGGTGYAEGGARIEVDVPGDGVVTQTVPGVGSVPVQAATRRSIKTQIDDYLAEHGNAFREDQLVLIQGGANDFFQFFANTPPADLPALTPAFLNTTVTAMVRQLGRLRAAGARHIVYANLPDLGLTPQFRAQGPTVAALATQLSDAYNGAVAQQVAGQGIMVFDIAALIREVVAAPATLGLTNVTTPACNSYTTPGNPATLSALICSADTLVAPGAGATYLFADGVHPTDRAHAVWGGRVAQLVLAPR
ncbi:SGNH/GDSL hydrolase family protein [Chitiniphilus purpureus]|uniref:SGNH/GDSL hydrolase family protein n=1 Tax=Chitiniphilus purpureus TaxID=2981137 RepID=A0ABY6DI78_9NEIS|nr:SGNH/GDSL hydrolase family protein [Chitiniphilus sp. CD1]UXY14055.1 SGNH/GDSL hydrolase family protein [Chitiniphilus sp. CD1]